ncbi:MAG: thioredoxin family protein [Pseudomonadota bacterium]
MLRAVLAMVGVLALGPAWGETRSAEQFFDPKFGDFKSELESARKQGKRGVLIMFELDDCPFCHRMKQTVLNQAEVQEYFRKHFLVFTVDIKGDTAVTDFQGKDTTEKAFAFDHRVRATPVFGFFDLDGRMAYRFTGATRDVQEFMQLGRFVVDGVHKQPGMSFAKYKQQAAQ